jgi:hypothetical protein
LAEDPLDPAAAAQAAQSELSVDESSDRGGDGGSGRQQITVELSVEQDITVNAEDSLEDIRAEIERLTGQGAEDALAELERKLNQSFGLTGQ